MIPAIGDMIRWGLKLPNRFAERSLMNSEISERNSRLTLEIDFPALGLNHDAATISELRASDITRKVLERLASAMGPDVLKMLATMREGRRPLVSTDPYRDSRIGDSDETHQHQPIGMTDFFDLTNTENPQKVKDLKQVAGTLGFCSSHFRGQ